MAFWRLGLRWGSAWRYAGRWRNTTPRCRRMAARAVNRFEPAEPASLPSAVACDSVSPVPAPNEGDPASAGSGRNARARRPDMFRLHAPQDREELMLEHLENQQKLTANQWKIFAAATIGDMLDFFDYLLIGFILAFIVKDWHLTYGSLSAASPAAIARMSVRPASARRSTTRPIFPALLPSGCAAGIPVSPWIFPTSTAAMCGARPARATANG